MLLVVFTDADKRENAADFVQNAADLFHVYWTLLALCGRDYAQRAVVGRHESWR